MFESDGPDHFALFQRCQALIPEYHKQYIVGYLRMFKGQGEIYQDYLVHYTAKFAKPEYKAEFYEFIAEIEDKKKVAELKKLMADNSKPVIEETEEPKTEEVAEVVEEAKEEPKKKKKGRPKKKKEE